MNRKRRRTPPSIRPFVSNWVRWSWPSFHSSCKYWFWFWYCHPSRCHTTKQVVHTVTLIPPWWIPIVILPQILKSRSFVMWMVAVRIDNSQVLSPSVSFLGSFWVLSWWDLLLPNQLAARKRDAHLGYDSAGIVWIFLGKARCHCGFVGFSKS